MPPSHQATEETPIFPPFNFSRWRAVDDRVREGSSVSHFDPVEIDMSGQVLPLASESDRYNYAVDGGEGKVGGKNNRIGARFWGTLDTKTLGGAGFASQSYRYGPSPLHLSRTQYKGIILSLRPDPLTPSPITSRHPSPLSEKHNEPSSPTTFTLVLKTSPTRHIPSDPRVPPVPRAAQLTYEASFARPENSWDGDTSSDTTVRFGWGDFRASYRGREVKEGDPKWVPLDTNAVYEISVMCRSGFGEQEGEFGVLVTGLSAWAKEGWWTGVVGKRLRWPMGWWTGVVGRLWWFMGWWRGIKLDDCAAVDKKRHLMV